MYITAIEHRLKSCSLVTRRWCVSFQPDVYQALEYNSMDKVEGYNTFKKRKVRRPANNKRRQMLDMRQEKYFRFDLDDLLTEFQLGDNKNTIAATILNKMTSRSMDDAFYYINRLKSAETLSSAKGEKLKALLQRYSKWR